MKISRHIVLVFSLLLLNGIAAHFSAPAHATPEASEQSQDSASPTKELLARLDKNVSQVTLSNGLRVLLFPRRQAPVFSGQIWVKVGSVNETPGVTGVSHMLEHMAFKGSPTIGTKDYAKEKELLQSLETLLDQGKSLDSEEARSLREQLEKLWIDDEFTRIYQTRGASGLNAGTGKDYTLYMVSLPNTAFELWCWMESDRLLNPVFRQFYKERDVVGEERRMRVDDNPGGKMYEALLALAYKAHPNRLPTIGWESDVHSLRVADIEKIYAEYYRPDNMVVALVGDLEMSEIAPTLEKYFGRIPKGKGPIPQVRTVEPKQEGERRSRIEFDASPQVMIAFHKPVYPHKDDMQFAILHSVLSEGRSSLLQRELVQRRRLAASIYTTEAPGELYPSLFIVGATPNRGVSNEQLITAIQEILDSLKDKPVAAAEIEAAKKRLKVDLLTLMSSNYGLARTLARLELLWGDWRSLFSMYDITFATSAEDLTRLAKTYFTTENRTVVELVQGEKGK